MFLRYVELSGSYFKQYGISQSVCPFADLYLLIHVKDIFGRVAWISVRTNASEDITNMVTFST